MMKSLMKSHFPAVLTEYLPSYEPSFAVGTAPKRGESNQHGSSSCKCHNAADIKITGKRSPSLLAPKREARQAREATIILQRRRPQHEKRYEKNYKNWELAKAELKEKNIRNLRLRIKIQHELIRKQDELAVQRRKAIADEDARRRESDKELRQEQIEVHQNICRQSLDEDRKRQAQEAKAARGTIKNEHGSMETLRSYPSKSGGPYKKPMRKQTIPTDLQPHTVTGPQPSVVREENEEKEKEEQEERREYETVGPTRNEGDLEVEEAVEENDEPVPWHAEQLYKLYGPKADYFLKPKLEDKERKKTATVINPKQMKQRGRAGAGPLWTSLRNESQAKLMQQDMQISPELKAAYSAFVRQCLARRKKPVKRHFSAQEDAGPPGVRNLEDIWKEQVPEMDRLLDQSKVLAAHDYKHMVEVMYRASVTNHDRTGILRHNNPPPNLNNWTGDESCARYMPSWIPTYDEEDDSETHTKWLSNKKQNERPEGESRPHTARSEQGQGDGAQLSRQMAAVSVSTCTNDEWEFLKNIRRKRGKPKTPKYIFLTEEAATCAGEFSKQHKEKLETRNIPKAYDKGRVKAQSALAMVDDNSSRRTLSARSMPRSSSELSQRVVKAWQPLSLDALVEYKEMMSVLGNGDFNHGGVPRWSVEKAH